MSNAVIQARYDELDAVARRFEQRAQAIGELRSRLQRAAQALEQGGWQGQGAAAFFGEMNGQLVPATQRLAEALDQARIVTLEISVLLRRAEQEAAAPFRGAVDDLATVPAESAEGVESFLAGAIAGSWSDNNSWSAVAGQTLVGLVPLAGQAADVRDIIAAAKGVYDGEDSAWAGLGISLLAVVPGLDFLKGGSRIGRKVLRQVAEEPLSQIATGGLAVLSAKLSREGLERAAKEVRVLKVAREEMMTRLSILRQDAAYSEEIRKLSGKAHNALRDHLKEDDLVGALQDVHGVPVVKHGKLYQHIKEVNEGVESLENLSRGMKKELKRLTPGTAEYQQLSIELSAVKETKQRLIDFLEIK